MSDIDFLKGVDDLADDLDGTSAKLKGSDRPFFITDEEKKAVMAMYYEGIAVTTIAKKIGRAYRSVKNIIEPGSAKAYRELQESAGRSWRKYYDKEKHRQRMKEYRRRKAEGESESDKARKASEKADALLRKMDSAPKSSEDIDMDFF